MISSKNKKIIANFFDLFLISFLSLFLELAMIRWVPGVVSSIAYFTNIILISTFLGLGLGCAVSGREKTLFLLPSLLVFLVSICILLGRLGISCIGNLSDFIFLKPDKGVPMIFAIPMIFFLSFSVFFHIGVILGKCLGYFKPLISYSINVFASIVGIAVFTFLSFKFMPPYCWFFIAFILLLWFLRKQMTHSILCLTACLILIYLFSGGHIWSPYYKIEIGRSQFPGNGFFGLKVNNMFFQTAFNFSRQSIDADRNTKHWKEVYNLPYLFTNPKSVLIVGSGVGNDVALAAEHNVSKVDAVEIDPAIINIDRILTPKGPYSEPNVKIFIDDARSYINNCKEKYDLIVYGFLDSHALFTNMASVRLDNFVYTVEGVKKAKSLLSKDGTIALSFFVGRYWVGNKIYYMLKDIFGKSPLVYVSKEWPTETIFIISQDDGKMMKKDILGFSEISSTYSSVKRLPIPTDDWPYFYLENKVIPSQYLVILLVILFLSVSVIMSYMPRGEKMLNYVCFFFLGTAFMLIETKSIVQLSLLFGTTWLVNAVVISVILLMILIANLCAMIIKPAKVDFLYILLLASLLLNWFIGPKDIALQDQLLKILISTTLVTLPLFFAAIIFAFLFRNAKNVSMVFGINLLGVVLGGFLEYFSLVFGLNKLVLLALFIYFLSYLTYKKTIALAA